MKPKENYKGDPNKTNKRDLCQTPPYALNPLLPYIKQFKHVWEPAAGEGYLVRALESHNFQVTGTDILTGDNFFNTTLPEGCEVHVTNPAFSIKYVWWAHCYTMELPFALLMPVEVLGSAQGQTLCKKYGAEFIVYPQRVDFKMPDKGWKGKGAQFPTMWVTWGLNIGQQITYAELNKPNKKERDEWANENP